MNQVRYGIIGVGVQGRLYADFIKDGKIGNSILSALCTTSEEKGKRLKDEYLDVEIFLDYKEMILSKKIDAIITTCPSQYHVEIAKFALENGVHVLNEKPAGINSKSVKELEKVIENNKNIAYSVFFNQRTNTIFQEIKKIVETKQLGDFRRLNWIVNDIYRPLEYYHSGAWRAKYSEEGGGLIINQAQHNLDIICYMVGLPRSLYAKLLLGYQKEVSVDTDISIIFEFDNGATGSFIACTHDMLGTNRLELDFSGGKIVVENGECAIYTFFDDEKNVNLKYTNKEFKQIENVYKDKKIIKNENAGIYRQYILYIENFTNHILKGDKLITQAKESGYSVLISDAVNLSNYYKKELELPINDEEYARFLDKKIEEENR